MDKLNTLILFAVMLQVSETEIKNRLARDNPWWETGRIVEDFLAMRRRGYFTPFRDLVCDRRVRRALVLMGPRRVGKTVMIYQVVQDVIDGGTRPDHILYVSLDQPLYNNLSLEKLLLMFMEIHEHPSDAGLLVFFDEVQYLKDWEVHLKSLVDSYRDFRFVASGSAAAALRLKARESGAGRFTDFLLPSLTFAEYLDFSGLEAGLIGEESPTGDGPFPVIDIEGLNAAFVDYLNYGGYPEAVFSPTIREDSARYIRSDIIDKVLLRDLPSLYGIQDIQELNSLFTTLAYNTGNEISLEGLAQTSGVAKNTLRRYIEYLEAAFLIFRVRRIDRNAKRFKREMAFKIYLTNPSMHSALFGPVGDNEDAMGRLAETGILSQWFHSDMAGLYYARWKDGEVDVVLLEEPEFRPSWALEVKWTDRYFERPEELTALLAFSRRHHLDLPLITTRTRSGTIECQGVTLEFEPASQYCYTVGRNVVEAVSRTGHPFRRSAGT